MRGLALLWSLLLLFPSLWLGRGCARQLQALSWPAVSGQVLESRVEVVRNSDSQPVYLPIVRYDYRVAGRHYRSERFRWGTHFTTASWAAAQVGARPAGATTVVRYDPADPQRSCLDPGLNAGDLQALLLLLPFQLVGWLLWFSCPPALSAGVAGFPLIQNGRRLALAIRFRSIWFDAGAGLFAVTFLAAFVNAALAPDEALLWGEVGLALAAAGEAARRRWRLNQSPDEQLLMEIGNWLRLPGSAVTIPWNQVRDWPLEIRTDAEGDISYRIGLLHTSGERDFWLELTELDRAERLRDWLLRRFDLPLD